MATLRGYKCMGCGYEIMASPEGHDYLMMGKFTHFLCRKCRDIVEVHVHYGEEMGKPVCPNCQSEELEKWNPVTGKCPKCGRELKGTREVIFAD